VAIALAIAERSRSVGYRGVAGFDIGVTSDGRPFVFDLNFRIVSSTPQVLLHEGAVSRVNARISQSWGIMLKGALEPALSRMSDFSRSGEFIPTRLYEATADTGGMSLITGMVVAPTLNEVESIIVNIESALKEIRNL
jgi:biotin carboxylase